MLTQTIIHKNQIQDFCISLLENERSPATIKKYAGIIEEFARSIGNQPLHKILLLDYREKLRKNHKAQTVNAKLSALNSFLEYINRSDLKLKLLRVQRRAFVEDNRELSEEEYKRLLLTAKEAHNDRLYHVMLTICSTGIRISELKYITVESVKYGRAEISMKGKERVILIPKKLKKQLLQFASKRKIHTGYLFITKTGKPLDRSNICHDMKRLCHDAKVEEHKVFPHNLRHLFARSFYAIERNLSYLADILGHSNIETTRIYVATSAKQCEKTLKKMQLVI